MKIMRVFYIPLITYQWHIDASHIKKEVYVCVDVPNELADDFIEFKKNCIYLVSFNKELSDRALDVISDFVDPGEFQIHYSLSGSLEYYYQMSIRDMDLIIEKNEYVDIYYNHLVFPGYLKDRFTNEQYIPIGNERYGGFVLDMTSRE